MLALTFDINEHIDVQFVSVHGICSIFLDVFFDETFLVNTS